MLIPSPGDTGIDRSDRLERYSLGWAALGAAMLVVIATVAASTLHQVNVSDRWFNHTFDVLSAAQLLRTDLGDARITAQGYLASGNEKYLARHRNAAGNVMRHLAAVRELTADDPTQKKQMEELEPLLTDELKDLDSMMALRESAESDRNMAASREGEQVDRIRQQIRKIEAEEDRLLRQRSGERDMQLLRGLGITIVAALAALAAILLGPVQLHRALKLRDAADRRRRESESIAGSLLEAAPQAIIIVDKNATIMMANTETERLFGHTPDELAGQPLATLIPERLRAIHAMHDKGFFADPRNRPMGLNLDLKALRKDGKEFDAEISLGYFETDRGTLAVAFVSDVSQRKANERAIEEQREELRKLAGKLMTAQDDERRMIARNLHDDLSQRLASITMDLGKLVGKHPPQEIVAELRTIRQHASEAAAHVRQISHQLHPSILDDLGLKVALEELCKEFESWSGIMTHFRSENMPDYLPRHVSNCIYHIAGESLRNAAKHSQGGTVFVDVGVQGKTLQLNVTDNGVGFSAKALGSNGGIGIMTMKERARLVGGKVWIEADSERGTRVSAEVPVTEDA